MKRNNPFFIRSPFFLALMLCLLLLIYFSFHSLYTSLGFQNAREKSLTELSSISMRMEIKKEHLLAGLKRFPIYKEVVNAFQTPKLAQKLLLPLLSKIKDNFQADIVYMMNSEGTVIASTILDNRTSLVNENYQFRPYFKDSLQGNPVFYPAVGVTTGKRGLYLGLPLTDPLTKKINGVLSVKLNADFLEKYFHRKNLPIALMTSQGVIFASNISQWLYHLGLPLPPDQREAILKTRQFSGESLASLPFQFNQKTVLFKNKSHWVLSLPTPFSDLSLYALLAKDSFVPLTPLQIKLFWLALLLALFFSLAFLLLLYQRFLKKNLQNQLLLHVDFLGLTPEKIFDLTEEKFLVLFENARDLIFSIETSGRFRFANLRFRSLLGLTPKNLAHSNLFTLIPPSNQKNIMNLFSSLSPSNPRISLQTQLQNTLGQTIEVEGQLQYIPRPNKEVCIRGVFRDISVFQDIQNRVKTILDSVNAGIIVIDAKTHTIVDVNSTAVKMFGLPAEQITSRLCHNYICPQELGHCPISDLGKQVDNAERTLLRGDGTAIPVLKTVTPVMLGDKEHFIETFVDLRELKETEQALKIAKEKAETATRAKSEFLANMSHEIRTPMNAIIGLNHLLQKTSLTIKQKDYSLKIERSSRNLMGIINDILDFSKIESGKLDLERIPFDLNELLFQLSEILRGKAQEKGLDLIIRTQGELPFYLWGDPLRLHQILLNLATNAIKFTEKGEVELTIKSLNPSGSKNPLLFSVKDTGIGISEEQAQNLFQSFTQADTSTTRKYGGTGLGLTISKQLVELMGGKLDFTSKSAQGSHFYFQLELETATGPEQQEIFIPKELNNLKFALITPDPQTQKLVSHYIGHFKLSLQIFESSEKALEILSSPPSFDALLIDWQLKNSTGFELIKQIQTNIPKEQIPKLILMTEFGRESLIKKAEKIPLDALLIKPISQSLLFDTIIQLFASQRGTITSEQINHLVPQGFEAVRGASILLVEDNQINQQVATELLEAEGFWITVANHGLEAVEQIKEHSAFDLVLMDLQMPEMDGYDATKAIRFSLDQKDLPIIAMTADAIAGIREKALACGMNDYLTKPINPAQLFGMLLKWITPGKRTPYNPIPSPENTVDSSSSLRSLKTIDVDGGLSRLNQNKKLYTKLLLDFYGENKDFISRLQALLQDQAWSDAEHLTHTLKGTSGNLGIKSVHQNSSQLNNLLKSTQPENYLESFTKLEESLNTVLEELSRFYETEQTSAQNNKQVLLSPGSLADLAFWVKELEGALKKNKPKDCERILSQIHDFSWSDKIETLLKSLAQLIDKYQFKPARNLLDELIAEINP